jgi:hypothetical protein
MNAVGPYLVGKFFFIHVLESQLSEKSGLIGQGEYPGDTIFHCLTEATQHQTAAHTLPLPVFQDCQRTDLGQIIPADMQRTDP